MELTLQSLNVSCAVCAWRERQGYIRDGVVLASCLGHGRVGEGRWL